MSKAPPSFQFFPADWLIGTAGLSHSSKATYLLLLCYEWTCLNVYFEPSKLSKMLGISGDEFSAHWEELADKFTIDDDGYIRNDRLEDLRAKAIALSVARQKAGSKGGFTGGSSKAKANLKQKASPLKTEDRRLKTEDRRLKTEEMDAHFGAFWSAVPAKVGKARARAHYAAAVEALVDRVADPHSHLLERILAYAQSDRAAGRFGWEPCSWLRDGHYDDDPEAWNGKAAASQRSAKYLMGEEDENAP